MARSTGVFPLHIQSLYIFKAKFYIKYILVLKILNPLVLTMNDQRMKHPTAHNHIEKTILKIL